MCDVKKRKKFVELRAYRFARVTSPFAPPELFTFNLQTSRLPPRPILQAFGQRRPGAAYVQDGTLTPIDPALVVGPSPSPSIVRDARSSRLRRRGCRRRTQSSNDFAPHTDSPCLDSYPASTPRGSCRYLGLVHPPRSDQRRTAGRWHPASSPGVDELQGRRKLEPGYHG